MSHNTRPGKPVAIRSELRCGARSGRRAGPNEARRRLLKLGAYVPPAVLGMMIVGGLPREALAVGSCAPTACQPCIDMEKPDIPPQERRQLRRQSNKKRLCFLKPDGCAPICGSD